jgi:RNA polymerase sigma-70 factor (ECF subfamily)
MRPLITLTDEELLASDDPEAFGVFYDRHVRPLLGYFARRTADPEVAADLTAETFASAIVARRRFRPGGPPAAAWLYTIAARRLADLHRRGRVDERVRRSLAMERRPLSAADTRTIRLLADDTATVLLAGLPDDQRVAVTARIVEDRAYADVADATQSSEAAVRQRVSRGLLTLRRRMGGSP